MSNFLEELFSSAWNRLWDRHKGAGKERIGTSLGFEVRDDTVTRKPYTLSCIRRTTHVAVLGKTGSGKSSLLRRMAQADIEAGRGFIWFDLHGDATPFLLGVIAEQERKLQRHLSDRVVLIAPADREYSVGFNPLEAESPDFVRIAEFATILKQRWGLDHFGARTDELLRNALYVLAANGMNYCFQCGHVTPGEPMFCQYCGRSYDVKLCPRLHPNPRSAEVCSRCGSRELSTPQPKVPAMWKLLAILVRLGLGLLLVYLTLSFLVALAKTSQFQQAFVCIALLLVGLWLVWSKLPDWLQDIIRSAVRRGRKNDDD